jgi:hypothetical protein
MDRIKPTKVQSFSEGTSRGVCRTKSFETARKGVVE